VSSFGESLTSSKTLSKITFSKTTITSQKIQKSVVDYFVKYTYGFRIIWQGLMGGYDKSLA
jgi:hypothetical protein